MIKATPPKRPAISYSRFSSSKQAKGDTQERQDEMFRDFCIRHGLSPQGEVYADRGLSGYKDKHRTKGRLGQLIAHAKAKRFASGTVIVVEAWDRLGRLRPDRQTELIAELLRTGVSIGVCRLNDIFCEEDFGTHKWTSLATFVQLAYQESKQKADRVAAAWRHWREKAAAGHKGPPPGRVPAWLRRSPNGLETIPEAVVAVQRIFRWACEGLGVKRIVARLSGEKVAPVGRLESWNIDYVQKLLRGRGVLGEIVVKGGQVIQGVYPAIIDEATWGRARKAMQARQRPRRRGERSAVAGREGEGVANLFTGLIRFAADGCFAHQHHYRVQGRTCRSLVSAGALHRPGQAGGPAKFQLVPYHLLEAALLDFVHELKPTDLEGRERSADEEAKAVLDGRIADLEGRIARAQAAAGTGEIDAILGLLAKLDSDLKNARRERDRLAARLGPAPAAALTEAQTVLDLLRSTTPDKLTQLRRRVKCLLLEVIESVWLLPWDVSPTVRAAEIQVTLCSGAVRGLMLAWATGGAYPGLAVGFGRLVGLRGKDAHLADKRLPDFRADPAVRKWFARHTSKLAPAVLALVRAEVELRRSLARGDRVRGTDALGEYLASSLDGLRPPKRPGRPCKAKAD